MIKLFTDTDTDMTPEVAKSYGYSLISMPYIVNGKEIHPYEDFKTFDSKTFYDMLRKGTIPSTCALNPADYVKIFEPVFKNGDDILYVHFSAAMTGTFNYMKIALDELKEKYPQRKFYQIDTKGITIMSYIIVREIGDMYKAGKSITEIMAWSKTEIVHYATYFYVNDLKFFQKSGRVKGFAALMGNLIGLRPIIYMDQNGIMTNIAKKVGENAAINALLNYVETIGDNIKDYRIIIGHSDCIKSAKHLEELLIKKYGTGLKIEYVVVNPTAGSHCGPNGVGIAFHSLHR